MQAAYTKKLLVLFCIAALPCAGFIASQPALPTRILASNTIKHLFSAPQTLDVFKLTISGKTLEQGSAVLQITNAAGKVIYQENFKAYWLLNELDELDKPLTTKQKEEYIRKRVREFFAEKNFSLTAGDLLGPKYENDLSPSETIWEEFHADKTAIGFGYLLSYENHRKIAWSKKMKKVAEYWACC